jgi:hypothetical protein
MFSTYISRIVVEKIKMEFASKNLFWRKIEIIVKNSQFSKGR